MKTKRTGKILSLILVACMVFTMLPVAAFAEGGPVDSGTPPTDTEITGFMNMISVYVGEASVPNFANATEVIDFLKEDHPSISASYNNVDGDPADYLLWPYWPITTWLDTDGYNLAVPGSYTFTAVLGAAPAGYANTGDYKATVEVIVSPPDGASIIVTKQPESVTVTQGAITENLTTTATASNGKPISYQWYETHGDTANTVAGGTSSSFSIPTDLTAGIYKYFCILTAEGCEPAATLTSTVTVGPPGSTATTYTATLSIQLDGAPYTDFDDDIMLKLNGNESTFAFMTGTGATRTASVQSGMWKVYLNEVDTGVTITVNNAPASATLDWILVTSGIIPQGTATGGIIDTNGNDSSWLACLKGDTLTFTAIGAGAASYNYAWSGTHNGNPINGTGNAYRIDSVQGRVNISCTITGNGTVPSGITITTAAGLKTALEGTTPATINVTADITLTDSINVNADHTLNIPEGKTTSTSNYQITIPGGKTLTLSGQGTLKADNANLESIGIKVAGTLQIDAESKLVAANTGINSSGITMGMGGATVGDYDQGVLISNAGRITIKNSGSASTGINSSKGAGNDSVILKGGTLTVQNTAGTGIFAVKLTIQNSCAVIVSNSTEEDSKGIQATDLLIKDCGSVTIASTAGYGVYVQPDSTFTVDNSMLLVNGPLGRIGIILDNDSVSGASMLLQNNSMLTFNNTMGYGLWMQSGAKAQVNASLIRVSANGGIGIYWVNPNGDMQFHGANNGKISFAVGAKLMGPKALFSDRGVVCTRMSSVEVEAEGRTPSSDLLTSGEYVWNGSLFAKGSGTISPIDITGFAAIPNENVGKAGSTICANGAEVLTLLQSKHPYASALHSGTKTLPWPITGWEDTDGYNPTVAGSYTFTAILAAAPPTFANSAGHKVTVEVVVAPTDSGSTTYAATVNGSYASPTGAGSYAKDTTVNIYAGNRSGYTFTGWTSSDVTITGASSKNASFVMPGKAVTVTANWSYNGGGSYTPPPATTPPQAPPNQPVTASTPVTATAGVNGAASASIIDKAITDAIAKAQADAKAHGSTANGISVALNISIPPSATSLRTTLPRSSLSSLITAGVNQLGVNGAPVSLGLNQSALQSILSQTSGGITIGMTPGTGLSAPAQSMIGNRPVYNITISYTDKNGNAQNITSFGSGMATLAIPYTPGRNEAPGYLFGVYVDGNGNASRIPGSVYDANSGRILIPTNHLSVYGVGYTAPSAKFTDVANHWAKESMNYVVGRGLLSGTSETTFAPNTAMTRGMLVTALGSLAGVDAKAYNKNNFTDVKADSSFRPYIEWAYSKGIVQGIGNNQFAPDRGITREEIALIFANYAKATGYKLPVTREATAYVDASSIGSAYKDAVTAMQQAGIMMGEQNNKFNPKSNATRAEVSSMLHRYIKLTIDPSTAQGWALNDAGQYLYYKDGKVLTGWMKDGDNWRYHSGNKVAVGWVDISDKRYYFTKEGLMVSGKWLQIDSKWYYFNVDGSLAKNTKVGGYEVDKNGVRKSK